MLGVLIYVQHLFPSFLRALLCSSDYLASDINKIRRLLNTLVRLWFIDWMDLASVVDLCVYISALISGTNLRSIQTNACKTCPDCIFVIH